MKCRKKGAANWGNSTKKESFEIDPKKHKDAQKKQKMRNLAIGNENPNEKKVAEKKAGGPKMMGEELNIDLAVDYFFTEGINEDGLEMIIEETGLEKFVEFVDYLTDIEVLTEARAARKARKGAKSYEQVKAEIDAKEKAKSVKREISVDKTKKATATAKAKQPEKKPVRDAIARGVFRAVDAYKKGMDRHNAAMATAKKAGKVAGKAAGEFAKGAGEGVKTAGKVAKVAYKVATKEETELEEKKKSGDPCWVGYKQVGMKKKGGKMVPNCVPVSEGKEEMLKKMNASREGFMAKDGPNKAAHDAKQRILKKTKEKMNEDIVNTILEKCWAGYEKKGMKTMFGKRYPNCVKKKATRKEEVELDERTRYAKETGKDPQTGKPSVKGGDEPSPAMKAVKSMAKQTGGLMSSRGKAIQPQGKKKVPGAKGLKGVTPADRIKGMLAKKRAPQPNPYKPRAGESD